MQLPTRVLVVTGSLALICSTVTASATAAGTTTTFPLRGTRMASMAHGIAHVTQLSAGDYKVVLTISALPAANTLHTRPIRHAYVAWAFNAGMMRQPSGGSKSTQGKRPANPAAMLGKLTPIALHETGAGMYSGTGTIMMQHVPGIIVTAEVSAMTHTPAMPFWGVLIGTPMMQQ
jgi:hypothetical protein